MQCYHLITMLPIVYFLCRTMLGAWPSFVFSLVYIALLTLVIEQVRIIYFN